MLTLLVEAAASALVPGARIALEDREVHHARVRRAGEAEIIRWSDGAGRRGDGELHGEGNGPLLLIRTCEQVPMPVACILGVGAGDRERFAWLAEKATELGVTALVPIETERTRSVATRVREAHVEKLNRRALEAVKQCGGAWATRVLAPVELADFVATTTADDRLIADAGGIAWTTTGARSVAVLVGPEGGWTEAERSAARAAGFRRVAIGANILRFETAALAAAALVAAARTEG